LIDERDAILENLEIAETRYINSFRLTTPEPSIADYQPPKQDSQKPHISLPKKLSAQRRANPAYGSSSLTPTSFVAPTQFYSLRGVRGVTGGQFAGSALNMGGSFTESIRSRLVGSRFQEVNRSTRYGELPMGSRVNINEYGELGPVPDPRLYGPNQPLEPEGEKDDGLDRLEEEGWVDLEGETSPDMASHPNGTPEATASSSFRRPRLRQGTFDTSSSKRETFPFRQKTEGEEPPPHLRLQPSQPFVRPLEGMDYDQLGHIYADITLWRSKLKAINVEISDAQHHAYNDIADGARIKGWLMVGRGLHYIPNVQLVEGRAKEDIRWDVLQNERSTGDSMTLWALVFVIAILLACGCECSFLLIRGPCLIPTT
jgi:calcium permeable stress-gated cation channel